MTCANHPDRQSTAFCQNCGKPLCGECTRTVGTAVFCEPCLAARLGGAPTGNYPPAPLPPADPGEPSPGLAAILGVIPGVGAMYNGQYAKGIVHLIVFAVLCSIASHGFDIFGLFVAGWIVYQIFDAHHTARARRDGTPLPNPFGLNDLGERLGFDKGWVAPPADVPVTPPPPSPAAGPSAEMPPPNAPPYSYNYNYSYQYPPVPPTPPPAPFTDEQMEEMMQAHSKRFPTAAFWLIGLGILFTISNTHLLPHSAVHELFPLLLIAFGVWIFFRRMNGPRVFSSTGVDDEVVQRMRTAWAIRSSFWLIFVGVLWLLDTWRVVRWGHSWPFFLIAAGAMLLLRRTAFLSTPAPIVRPPAPPAGRPDDPGTSIVPTHYSADTSSQDQER